MMTTRRLSAIVSMDVVGYARLMGADEKGTRATVRRLQGEVWEPEITRHRGRIVKTMGDGLLLEFSSLVDAIESSVQIQRAMIDQNRDVPDSRRVELRIGVDIGDVLVEGDDIHGDGVNVAARLEELADPGSICISGDAYRQVTGKVEIEFEDIGLQELKNIAQPIQAYRVVVGATSRPTVGETAELALPDRPSIAVLPFENMSGDSEQEYFSDGITEDIITSLSKISELFVIARHSTFAYKGKAVDIIDVSQKLGVANVLEGSVRKVGNRVRITAQLIDGKSGGHLWAERYDRKLDDIFAVQDEVTEKIVEALKVTLTIAEKERFGSVETSNMEAYDLVLRARDRYLQTTKDAFEEARTLLTRAIKLDGNYARAYSQLAQVCMTQRYHGWSQSPAEDLEYSFDLARRAVELDSGLPYAHSILASAHLWRGDLELAAAEAERAFKLEPNNADGLEGIAEVRFAMGHPAEALSLLDKAMRLNPHFPFYYLSAVGFSHLMLRNFEEAASTFERGTVRHPDFAPHHLFLAACYGHLGRHEEAVQAFSRAESMGMSMDQFSDILLARDPASGDLVMDGLRAAGLVS